MVKLNLGCGPHALEGWLNYDIDVKGRNDVIPLDLSQGKLPHADNSVDFIFSEHFIEHLTLEQGQKLLKECFRVLKTGGVIRISTPDLNFLCSKYYEGEHIGIPGVWEPRTPCQGINEGMRLWGHQFLYDYMELSFQLKLCGFPAIARQPHRISTRYPSLQNLEVRPFNNDLIIEAVKV